MTAPRIAPLALAAAAAVLIACNDMSTSIKTVPFGFITVVARTSGAAYATAPVGTFYDASGLSAPTSTAPWDSCRVQTYSPSTSIGPGSIYPSLDAGRAVVARFGARSDSLYPVAVNTETQYKLRSTAGIPYTPGDSGTFVVSGSSGGYPAITLKAKTAEAFSVTPFSTPASGSRLDLRWTPAHDANATMTFSFKFGALSADTVNTQVYCQFRDDGADSIPSRYIGQWAAARVRTWSASRVRTSLTPVARGGYLDFISTFDLPTPVSP